MKSRQALRSKFCNLLDEVRQQAKADQLHLLWWFAKEALYQLGVVAGDIKEG